MNQVIPATAVIPTANRAETLARTITSIAGQDIQPRALVIIDASDNEDTSLACKRSYDGLLTVINYAKAAEKGAAAQRNQGLQSITDDYVFFMDDDIILEPGCIRNLWACLQAHENAGGVNAMIINQQYHSPGKLTAFMYRVLSGKNLLTYAGKCIGPGWNLLPEDREGMPECNETEWLNTTCTLYKKDALPVPAFSSRFKGYSLLEDVALSLTVARKWKLYNARTARIFHDSQPGAHKRSAFRLSKMELINRHYIMVKVMGRKKPADYARLMLFEMFGLATSLTSMTGWKNLLPACVGKLAALGTILSSKTNNEQ